MIFQSLQLKFQKGPARHYSSESQTSQKTPWWIWNGGVLRELDSGGGRSCRLSGSGGEARRAHLGPDRSKSWSRGWLEEGRQWCSDGGGALACGEAGWRWGGHGRVQQSRADWGCSAVRRRGACAWLAASSSMPTMAWLENERGNNRNAQERGEHEHHRLTYS